MDSILRLTGNISVMSSPSGCRRSDIFLAQSDLNSGSMAQKNLWMPTVSDEHYCNFIIISLTLQTYV